MNDAHVLRSSEWWKLINNTQKNNPWLSEKWNFKKCCRVTRFNKSVHSVQIFKGEITRRNEHRNVFVQFSVTFDLIQIFYWFLYITLILKRNPHPNDEMCWCDLSHVSDKCRAIALVIKYHTSECYGILLRFLSVPEDTFNNFKKVYISLRNKIGFLCCR